MFNTDQIKRYASHCRNEAALAKDPKIAKVLHEAASAALNFALTVQAVDELRSEPFS